VFKRLQILPTVCCPSYMGVAALAIVMLFTLVACGSGGGGSSGGGGGTTTQSTSCVDATTCLTTISTIYGDTDVTSAIGLAASHATGASNCVTFSGSDGPTFPFTFTMVFTNCTFGTAPNQITVNGNFSMTDTVTTLTFSSSGLSVVGMQNNNAVNFSCTISVDITTASGAISGTICGTSISNLPAAPTGLSGSTPGGGACLANLSWAIDPGATSYNVYWSTATTSVTTSNTQTPEASNSASISSGGYTPTGFSFIVTGVNAIGEGTPSSVFSFSLAPCS
jgi:hypothetical protein